MTSWSRRLEAADRRPPGGTGRARPRRSGASGDEGTEAADDPRGVAVDDVAARGSDGAAPARGGTGAPVPEGAAPTGGGVRGAPPDATTASDRTVPAAGGVADEVVAPASRPVEPTVLSSAAVDIDEVLRNTMADTPDLTAVFSSVGHEVLWANSTFAGMVPVHGERGAWLVELLDEWSKGHYEVKVLPALVKYGRWRGHLTLLGITGPLRLSVAIVAHLDAHGEIDAVTLVARDATPPAGGPEDIRLAALVENPTEIILVCDPDGSVRYASPGALRLLGIDDLPVDGTLDLLELLEDEDRPAALTDLALPDDQGVGVTVDLALRTPAGQLRHVEVIVTDLTHNPAIHGLVLNARDITERVAATSALTEAAYTDALTGLPNRVRLLDRLAKQGESDTPECAVLMVDLDRFGSVNSQLGTEAADQVLTVVAERLAAEVAPPAWVARHSGDQFVVVAPGVRQADEAIRLAGRLRTAVTGTVRTSRGAAEVASSVGVALVRDVDDPEEVLLEAGRALTHAKESGRGRVEVYSPQLAAVSNRRQTMEAQLRHALEHDGVRLHYQSIVDVGTRAMVGAEALLRVRDGDGDVVNPAELIDAAESAGLMARLGSRVLESTAAELAGWTRVAGAPRQVSVNVSPRQLADPDLPGRVHEVLRTAGVDPSSLWLELGESTLIPSQPTVDAAISYLRALGVQVGLDDFGTGRSSLGNLKRFPLDFVKIDRSLVAGLTSDAHDVAIVRAIVELAHDLGLLAVAVGVETEAQLAVLADLGCDRAQGFLFSAPVGPAELVPTG